MDRFSDPYACRHYTLPGNVIDEARIDAAVALRLWPGANPRRSAAEIRTTFAAIARDEQAHFASAAMVASIEVVDAFIAAHCPRFADSLHREQAILAHHEGRPALIARDHNVCSAMAIRAVTDGEDLASHVVDVVRCEIERSGKPSDAAAFAKLLPYHAGRIMPQIAALNAAGRLVLEDALWRLADARLEETPIPFAIAAE